MKCTKVPYPTKKEALQEIRLQQAQGKHFNKTYKSKKDKKKLRIYLCPLCREYRLTVAKRRRKY